jgi:hypothetical protein
MTIFFATSALFLCSIGLHLLIWKIRLPKYHTRTLVILFALVLGAGMAAFPIHRMGLPQLIHLCLFYTSLSLCYVILYSTIEFDSPTLSLIRHLAHNGTRGLSLEEVRQFLEARPFVRRRLAALLHDGLVREENGRYFVAGRGSLFFRLILAFRALYGSIERGG